MTPIVDRSTRAVRAANNPFSRTLAAVPRDDVLDVRALAIGQSSR